jgi:signal transduction histidine kinase
LSEIIHYLHSRRKAICLFLVLEVLAGIILRLSGVTLRVLAYPMGLSAALFAVYGVYDYVLKAYSVREMVNQSVRYFARLFISRGISLRVEIPKECRIVTDEKWMVFVLKQLMSNALKYTPEGSITIDMPDTCHIRIADTGIGIAPEDLPRIFDRGYTGYNGRRDKKATGLGLFLVKNILTQLGAEIEVRSKVEQGTEVWIGIPYKNVRLQEEM